MSLDYQGIIPTNLVRRTILWLWQKEVCSTCMKMVPCVLLALLSLFKSRNVKKGGARFKGGVSRHEGFGVLEVNLLEPVISNF